MSKNKNKGFKKEKPAGDLLLSATVELKRFRRFAKQVKKLSTAQKVVGDLALLAAGYALLTKSTPKEVPPEAPAAAEPVQSAPDTPPNPVASASTPKPKRSKPAGTSQHSPFSQERP
ncbi:MAG: hypothetical protein ACRYFX_24885 [Janthinobacterium lividum]